MQSVCYTDGSKLGSGHTGSGIYFPDIQDSRENWISLGTSPTVFQAEVSAIHHAARLARENGDILGDREVIILSDSQAAIKALTRSKISSLCVRSCVEELNNLASNRSVTVRWVKAHVGIFGNETADTLAKYGASSPCFTPEPALPVAYNASRSRVRMWVQSLAAAGWSSLTTCRQTKTLFPRTIKPTSAKKMLTLSRLDMRHVIQIITGHCNLARHRRITGQSDSPICPLCGLEEETPVHLVEICPVFQKQRQNCLDGVITSLAEIVGAGRWKDLTNFLDSTGRLEDFSHENPDN